jgi:lysophospholipase L1-like esterase
MTVLRICFVGDSITAGTGDDNYLGWPGWLCTLERAKGHDITLYNLGIRADTSELIAARWRAECAARLPPEYPGALMFAFGVNEAAEEAGGKRRVKPDRTATLARAMLGEAVAWKPTLMIGPAPIDEAKMPLKTGAVQRDLRNARIGTLSRILDGIANDAGVPYLDLYTILSTDPVWAKALAAGDGVHPNGDGYARIAAIIGAWPAWRGWFDR